MKRFFGAILIAVALATASPVFAQDLNCQSLDISSMSPTDIEHAQALCKSTAVAAVSSQVTPEKVKEWASLGKDFAGAVNDTAKQLGETANQFLFTPLGMMLAFYFLWGKIGGVVIGIPLLIALWTLYCFICSRYSKEKIEYENVPVLWGAWNIRKKKVISFNYPNDVILVWALMTIPTLTISFVLLGCLIF